MPQRVLSITSLKNVCCYNAIPNKLRGQLICGSFHLYIWRLNLKQTLYFYSLPRKCLVLTLTENLIIQSEPEKQDKIRFRRKSFRSSQILNHNFLTHQILQQSCYNASDFDLKVLQLVRIWIKRKENALEFELKTSQHVRIWKKLFAFKKPLFVVRFTWWKRHIAFLMLFWKVWLWIKSFTPCQTVSVLLKFTKFSYVHQNRERLGNISLYGVGSVNQVFVLGEALCTPTVINVTRHIKLANPIRVCSSIYLDRECYSTRFLVETMKFATYGEK